MSLAAMAKQQRLSRKIDALKKLESGWKDNVCIEVESSVRKSAGAVT